LTWPDGAGGTAEAAFNPLDSMCCIVTP